MSTLMAMPAAKGLFHRAIVQSGANLKGVTRADAPVAICGPIGTGGITDIQSLSSVRTRQMIKRSGQAALRL